MSFGLGCFGPKIDGGKAWASNYFGQQTLRSGLWFRWGGPVNLLWTGFSLHLDIDKLAIHIKHIIHKTSLYLFFTPPAAVLLFSSATFLSKVAAFSPNFSHPSGTYVIPYINSSHPLPWNLCHISLPINNDTLIPQA